MASRAGAALISWSASRYARRSAANQGLPPILVLILAQVTQMDKEYLGGTSLCCALHTALEKEAIAGLYGKRGWYVRKCAWTDYEVKCSWAELVIEGESPILMHGPVTDVLRRVEEVLDPLRVAEISFTAECYDTDTMPLKEYRSLAPPQPNSTCSE